MMKKFVIIFLMSFVFLLAECQPVPEKTLQERAQDAYETVKEKAQEIFDTMHQVTKEAMDSARLKWQELMDSTPAPPTEGSQATGQDWISAGKNYISQIMGIATTPQPVLEP